MMRLRRSAIQLQVMSLRNSAVETASAAIVDVFDAGGVAQTSGAGAGFEPLLASQRHLVFDEQAEPLGMIEGACLGVLIEVLEGLRHAVKTEGV